VRVRVVDRVWVVVCVVVTLSVDVVEDVKVNVVSRVETYVLVTVVVAIA